MKAIILAGGFGTRLKSIVSDLPKPMVMIAGKPFLEHLIRNLRDQGITEVILCIHHMANKIKSYFGNGRKFGLKVTYSEEDVPLGTAGAIKKAEKYIDGTFLVLNGDSYSNIDLNKLLEFHKDKNSKYTLCLIKVDDSREFGRVQLEGDKIINFAEKSDFGSGLINSGIYVFEPEIFKHIQAEKNVSIEKEIFPELTKEGLLHGYKSEGYFIDIGRPETYAKFKEDLLENLFLKGNSSIREALRKMHESGTNLVLIVDDNKKLLGVLNEGEIKKFIFRGGDIDSPVDKIMFSNPEKVGRVGDSPEKINEILMSGTSSLPIIDENGIVRGIEFFSEKIKDELFPVIRGRAPLRISFAGGNTDLPYYFEKYGGAVVNATINKYCHASIIKRADNKIIVDSDLEKEIFVGAIGNLQYDGKFDLIKAIVKIMKPDFGFELHLHNDIPPGRGLGSSATFAVLAVNLIAYLQGIKYDNNKIAEIAYKAEREELNIKGGWQDQYASIMGGFNFMDFSEHKTIVYPLRLKEEIINELRDHLTLCFVGKAHNSGDIHKTQEKNLYQSSEYLLPNLNKIKEIAIEIKDSLLTNEIEKIGKLLHEAWQNKKLLSGGISDNFIDELYEKGLKNGAYGGKLLGAGGGGYLLFFHPPQKRNQLVRALKDAGGEIMDFDFESKGLDIWESRK